MAAIAIDKRKRMSPLRRKEAIFGYIAIMPWLIGFLVFTAGPMVFSAYLVFTEWELLTPPRWSSPGGSSRKHEPGIGGPTSPPRGDSRDAYCRSL